MLQAYLAGKLFGVPREDSEVPQVVALHGWMRHGSDFDAVLDAVREPNDPLDGRAIPSIALELPGFGVSPPPLERWGTANYADVVITMLAALPAPVVLLGHSFGARVALRIASEAPELLSGMVISGVPFSDATESGASRPRLGYRIIRAGARLGLVNDARLEAARQRYGSRDYREAEGVMRDVLVSTLQDDYMPLLPSITQRVELVWGADDTAAPIAGAVAASRILPLANLRVLQGVGHMVPLEAPMALRDALGVLLR